MTSKTKHKIKGVLFDFDGTLTYPGAINYPAIKRELQCPPDMPILEFLETLPPDKQAPLTAILEAKEEAAAQASLPNIGAEKCLSALKKRGIPIGIITRNSMQSVRVALEKFKEINLEDFPAVITREQALPKPNPDGVYQAAKRMGISTSQLLVVGDFRFDVMAGHAAGAQTALLKNSDRSVMIKGDPDPDFTVNHLEEILNLIDAFPSNDNHP